MSYDLKLGEEEFNITYNASYLFDGYGISGNGKSNDGIRTIYGNTGKEAEVILRSMVDGILDNYTHYRSLEWENFEGFGSIEKTLIFLMTCIVACKKEPLEIWTGD